MKRTKKNLPSVVTECGNPDFNWSLYDNGFNGVSLTVNHNVKCLSNKEHVYSHEPYAQDLYHMYMEKNPGIIQQKDIIVGTTYTVCDMTPVSSHEIQVYMDNGMNEVIDLIKEHTFIHDYVGCSTIDQFMENFDAYKEALLKNNDIKVKVVENGRLSIAEGLRSRIEQEFVKEIRDNEGKYAYNATIKEINGGGYIVDVMGLKCFLPGSLAAAGIITDFESLMGKTIPVMPINYMPKSGFVVSYKKYLNAILPTKIENELYVGQHISVKVTGTSKNGIFVTFKDKNDEYVFNGLVHRSVMSYDFENEFNRHAFNINDEFWAYINAINKTDDGYRIVLSDQPDVAKKAVDEKPLSSPEESSKKINYEGTDSRRSGQRR